jgi:drug/metabolite transporter (DMT)-like permease
VTTLSGAYPAVTLVYAYFVIKERPTFLQWTCIALVFVGMLLSSDQESWDAVLHMFLGLPLSPGAE